MVETSAERHPSIVDQPILNSPFGEPEEHWVFEEGLPRREHGRRHAGYWRTKRERVQKVAMTAEEFIALPEVNKIRRHLAEWKKDGYPGASRITLELLKHWSAPERERKLFFCQREAVETIIWLAEAPAAAKQGIDLPKDIPNDPASIEKAYAALRRYCCKMATGSGKTVAMAMLIAWSILNKVYNKQDKRFSDTILVVCPNLTVKKRLSVLYPSDPNNYYEKFDLVPRSLFPMLSKGRIMISNWHVFNPVDDSSTRSVVQRGSETDIAFCKRVLKDVWSRSNILVINDEAHHAYRPAPQSKDGQSQTVLTEDGNDHEEELEEATVWVNGLDRINAAVGVNFCIDMSATPYYIKGSGYEEGSPFQWIVSDFGLVDAIECGIVKIPRVPVDTNSGRPIPEYFELWKWVMEKLPWSERATTKRQAKPEAVVRGADGALSTLASEWKKTFDIWSKSDYAVPPVLIAVCQNTNISELIAEKIASGRVLPEFKNEDGNEVTLRIDSKLLEEAESRVEETKQDKAAQLRNKVSTVGKEGEPGANVRCVVSVGMLTEGWDAQNVTHILGLRAFTSQLLCEQVVGRGLRRTNYDDFSVPEYVDVYGIPFEVIPVAKAAPREKVQTRLGTKVTALPERKHLEIRFPRVEGYIFDVRYKITANIKSIPQMKISPVREPTEVIVKDAVGYKVGRPDRLGPGTEVYHNRDEFYANHRLQTTIYEIASDVTDRLKHEARRLLFPQVLKIVEEYVRVGVRVPAGNTVKKEEIALQHYRDEIINRLSEAIRPDTESGEPPILPVIERYRPRGSSSEVNFRTFKECYGTKKSHVSHVVADSNWEHSVMFQLEKMPEVSAYVKNDHLNFEIPYEFGGQKHRYIPDYLIKLQKKDGSVLNVILEVKGFEREQDRAKKTAVLRWVDAVNYHGEFGRWIVTQCRDPNKVAITLERLL